MAVTQFADGSRFVPIRSGQACPVCGSKAGRCSEFYNEQGIKVFYRCKNQVSSKPSQGWYIHLVKDVDGYDPNEKPAANLRLIVNPQFNETVTEADLALRDKVYRRLRQLVKVYEGCYLKSEDKKDLLRRGLTEREIEYMGFFSVPSGKIHVSGKSKSYQAGVAHVIVKDLDAEFGDKLLRVPGFLKLKDKGGNDYIALKTKMKDPALDKYVDIKGYFVPYFNLFGQMVGLQYRLTVPMKNEKGKIMRYFWYSSGQARSGSPIDHYIPINRQDRMKHIRLVTEGATKGKIACEKMGCEGFFEAGVSNYKALAEAIIEQEEIEDQKVNIILALDMDKATNAEVTAAEKQTVQLLKESGHQVAIAQWDGSKAKGIDDALQMGLKISYQLV